ncbi:hypothetical protein VQ02_14775 [Methylobacterium variabile]|jgi:hypothetical protein|uniref:Uncharacterized protein n=1 Tax=Methylobacterium variabile TaxID=298794 RepID=A0A0J6STZ1_9HYPH|nr:hypothetical protein [Methylobacterium variabile]KMO36828.1 hypothetical protein VQ02_14775 [Methylobacterium variabile]
MILPDRVVDSGTISAANPQDENRIEFGLIGREGLGGAVPVLLGADYIPKLHSVYPHLVPSSTVATHHHG